MTCFPGLRQRRESNTVTLFRGCERSDILLFLSRIDHYEAPFNFPSSYERSFSALAFKMSFDSAHIPSPSDDFLYHQPADHWAAYDQALALQQASMSLQFNSYPSAYPQPRLTPPPAPVTAGSQNGGPRLTLAGSLDPSTGIFYRTPEHPRLRTAQACEKCRTRKAKVGTPTIVDLNHPTQTHGDSAAVNILPASAVKIEAWCASTPRKVESEDRTSQKMARLPLRGRSSRGGAKFLAVMAVGLNRRICRKL